MKKFVVMTLLLLVLGISESAARLALILPEHAQDRPALAKSLIEEDVKVYYYNSLYIIADTDPEEYPGFFYPAELSSEAEKYYLLGGASVAEALNLQNRGTLYALPGSDYLFLSTMEDADLRREISGSLVRIDNIAIKRVRSTFIPPTIGQKNLEMEQLVNLVSADSVAYFIQALQDMQTRYALAENRFEVASWIKDTFLRFGISNAHLEEFTWNGTQQYNVVATIEGSQSPDEYIVVGGHHDSITYTQPLVFAPGADDNASGTVAALETARVLMTANYQPKCSIRFVTFAAEEFGLHGSHYNAEQALQENLNIRLMINHDMIANDPNNSQMVRLMPYDDSMAQSQHAAGLVEAYSGLSAVYGSANSHSSDSYAYWSRGFPVIYFFELDFSPVYHSDADVFSNLDPAYCAEVIKGSLACSVSFSNMPAAVENLSLSDPGEGNSLQLSWQGVTDPDIEQINVYYSTGDPTMEEPIPVYGADSYTVQGLIENQLYNFAVSTVDQIGNESLFSFVSGATSSIPRAPQNFVATPVVDAIQLNWQENSELDISGYKLWRADLPDTQLQLIHEGLLTENEFTDSGLSGDPEILYVYKVQAVDSDGNVSEYSELAGGRPATLDRGILVIDATSGGSGVNPMLPTDETVNSYYENLLIAFEDHQVMDLDALSRDLRLYDFCIYSGIIWHDVDASIDILPEEVVSALVDYLALGGKFFYNGYFPTKALAGNPGYPVTFAETDDIYSAFGIHGADYLSQGRMNNAISQVGGWTDLPVGEHASLAAFDYHVVKVESISAAPEAEQWYLYGSGYPEDTQYAELQGQSVGVYKEGALGESLILSFPLYVIEEQAARQFLYDLLHVKWAQPTSGQDAHSPGLESLQILPNYPNPFRESTLIEVRGIKEKSPAKLSIYNLRGQMIQEMAIDGAGKYHWDGRDKHGKQVSSGIYFVRIDQDSRQASRKLIKIK